MAPLARLTAAAVGAEVEAGWMKEWERQEMKCPWDISPWQRRKEGWRAKLKTAAQASNQSYCFTFQPQDRSSTVARKRAGNTTGNERETKKGFHTTGPTHTAHLSLIKNQCSWYSTAFKSAIWVYEPVQSLIRDISCSAPSLNFDKMLTFVWKGATEGFSNPVKEWMLIKFTVPTYLLFCKGP